jgi:hypothetical protein
MATWTTVWRVSNEGDRVNAYEASRSQHDNITVRGPHGMISRQGAFWFELYYGASPEEAIEKFLARQAQRLARLEQDRAEIQQQLTNAQALRAARAQEARQ